MKFRDYYEILGLDQSATQKEVKTAYRKKARKYHPDVSEAQDAEARFKEVGEAYEVLKDPEKRAAYDQLGENWQAGQQFEPPPNWDSGFEFSGSNTAGQEEAAFSDFFESLFGQNFSGYQTAGRQNTQQVRGEDHHAKVLIDISDAYHDSTRTITLQKPEIDANGQLVNKQHELRVKIPKGISQGQRIRLAGQGASGIEGMPSGDLYLEIAFLSHKFYRIEGKDLYINLPVTPSEVALCRKVKVPTPAGTVELSLPAGSESGKKLRLKGKGIPSKIPGDIYVVLQIVVPKASNEAQKDLYRKLEIEMPFNPRTKLGV